MVRSLTSVSVHMISEVILPPELLITVRTVIWSLISVNPLMDLKIEGLGEGFGTVVASISPLVLHCLGVVVVGDEVVEQVDVVDDVKVLV